MSEAPHRDLEGKAALITGAGHGIGRATAPCQAMVTTFSPETTASAICGMDGNSARLSSSVSVTGKPISPALAAATTGTAKDSGRPRPPT